MGRCGCHTVYLHCHTPLSCWEAWLHGTDLSKNSKQQNEDLKYSDLTDVSKNSKQQNQHLKNSDLTDLSKNSKQQNQDLKYCDLSDLNKTWSTLTYQIWTRPEVLWLNRSEQDLKYSDLTDLNKYSKQQNQDLQISVSLINIADCVYFIHSPNYSVAHCFWWPYRTNCPRDQILMGHGVLITQKKKKKKRGHQTCRQQNLWLSTKNEKIKFTDNQSRNSCSKVVSDHEVTFNSAIQPTKCNALWPCSVHDRLLRPKHGALVVWMHLSTYLCFELTWGLNLVDALQHISVLH